MTYTATDITELIHYHLVLGEPDDARADQNIAQLMRNMEAMSTRPLWEPISWSTCEECGAWVSSELIGPDGAGENPDGGFYCSECRFADEEV
jgi:hypothetical protein